MTQLEIDRPIEGFYVVKEWRGSPWFPVRISYEFPADPETGEPLDRSGKWHATKSGVPTDPYEIWPWAAKNPVSQRWYVELLAIRMDDDPGIVPGYPVDFNIVRLPEF